MRQKILGLFFSRCWQSKQGVDVSVFTKDEYMEKAKKLRKDGGILKDADFVVVVKVLK